MSDHFYHQRYYIFLADLSLKLFTDLITDWHMWQSKLYNFGDKDNFFSLKMTISLKKDSFYAISNH